MPGNAFYGYSAVSFLKKKKKKYCNTVDATD